MHYTIYSTVYNNSRTLEESLKSIFRPEYDIIVVDSCSNDGTHEKLMDLRQELNLKIIRKRCSRGEGRNLALKEATNASRTAYVDLDAIYNENFHILLTSEVNRLFVSTGQWSYFGKKEECLERGGWRDLNEGENDEFILRVGVEKVAPVIIGINQRFKHSDREKRYAKGIELWKREFSLKVDEIRGYGLGFDELPRSSLLHYLVARAKGIYAYQSGVNNPDLLMELMYKKMIDPAELGIADKWIALESYEPQSRRMRSGDDFVREMWGQAFKYIVTKNPVRVRRLNRMGVLYVKSKEGAENWLFAEEEYEPELSLVEGFNVRASS